MADDGADGRASPPSASRARRLPLEGRGAQTEWIVGRPLMDGHSRVGTLYKGVVTSVAPYGVFVRVSAGGGESSTLEGLLHVRYMRGGLDRYISPSSHYARGDDVQVVAIGAKDRYLSFGVLRAGAAVDWDAAVAGAGGGRDGHERRRGRGHSYDGGRAAERGRDRHDAGRRRGERADRRGGSRERRPTRGGTTPRDEPSWIGRVRDGADAHGRRSDPWAPAPPHKRSYPSPPRSPGGRYDDRHDDRRRAGWDGRADAGYPWAPAPAADAPPPDGGWPAKRPRGWPSPFSPLLSTAPGAGRGDGGGTPSSAWFQGPAERQGAPCGYPDGGGPRGDYGGRPTPFPSAPPPGAYGGLAGAAAGGVADSGSGGGAPPSAPHPYAYGGAAAPYAAAPGSYAQPAMAHWGAPTEQWQAPMAAAPRGDGADAVVGGGAAAEGRGDSGGGLGERPAAGGLPPQQAAAAATLWALLAALKAQPAPSAGAPPPAAVVAPAQPQADALSALGRLPLDRWLSSQLTAAPAAAPPVVGAGGAGGGEGGAPPRGAAPITYPGASTATAAAGAAPAGPPPPPPLAGGGGPATAGWPPPPAHDARRGEDAGVL